MQSGSNHFVTDDDEHHDGVVAANQIDDCDTCMDRREGGCEQGCLQEAPPRIAPVVPYSMRKERLNLDGNLSLDKGASPLLTEPCIQESASWEPSGITVKDKNKKSSRRQITTKNTTSKNRIHQPSNEQIFGLENNNHNASSLRSFALAGNAANQTLHLVALQSSSTLDHPDNAQNLTIRDNSASQALQNNYQTNASTMHFATTQGPSNQLFVAAGAGSRPATGTQKQVLQSTGEFIVPDLNQTNRVAGADAVTQFRRGSARPKLPRVSKDFDEIEGIKAGSQEESVLLTNSHGNDELA